MTEESNTQEDSNEQENEYDEYNNNNDNDTTDNDDLKVFVSRVPSIFDEASIKRLFEKHFGEDCIQDIALPLQKEEQQQEKDGDHNDHTTSANNNNNNNNKEGRHGSSRGGGGEKGGMNNEETSTEHRGFAFVTLMTQGQKEKAIEKGTIRGPAKESSKRKHTLYIRSIVRDDEEQEGGESNTIGDTNQSFGKNSCFLWSKYRCPYGDDCKFSHDGEGGCIIIEKKEKKKQKCFTYRTKGKCKLGDACPYRHDFEPSITKKLKKKNIDDGDVKCKPVVEKKDKDCINWKTKGKCRKGDKCPYRHDESVREAFLSKKRSRSNNDINTNNNNGNQKGSSNPQPLSVRVFGLNYDTKEEDVREYFEHCGVIREITFPTYEDSGRSKGYCGILFTSPKATEKACELDGKELHGRWLSVQPGKMYLKQWERREEDRMNGLSGEDGTTEKSEIGEFGQKVKRRKKHGHTD